MREQKPKIAVVVPGRFYAFDLVRELIKSGEKITLYTNYPKFAARRFGVPADCVRSLLIHGIACRIINFLKRNLGFYDFEPALGLWFSRWAAGRILRERPDIVYVFSGVAKDIFSTLEKSATLKILVRGSSHIRFQHALLEEEEKRRDISTSKPSPWLIEREEKEYQLADTVIVLSNFAYSSFIKCGIPSEKLRLIPLGVQLDIFRQERGIMEERLKRIIGGKPICVLMTGTFSLRKGAFDFAEIASRLRDKFNFVFVGSRQKSLEGLVSKHRRSIRFIPHQPQHSLPDFYALADIFLFTTIEDGYPVVLAQAAASGLPIMATPNSSAPDMTIEGKNGWILPIRSPQSFIDKLNWCDNHREELARMVRYSYDNSRQRDFKDAAADTIEFFNQQLGRKQG